MKCRNKELIEKWLTREIEPRLKTERNVEENIIDDNHDDLEGMTFRMPLLVSFGYYYLNLERMFNLNHSKMLVIYDLLSVMSSFDSDFTEKKCLEYIQDINEMSKNIRWIDQFLLNVLHFSEELNNSLFTDLRLDCVARISYFLNGMRNFNTFEKQLVYLMGMYLNANERFDKYTTNYNCSLPIPKKFGLQKEVNLLNIRDGIYSFIEDYVHNLINKCVQPPQNPIHEK